MGLLESEIEQFGQARGAVRNVGPRDLAACAVQEALGDMRSAALCRELGSRRIRLIATGGLEAWIVVSVPS
jgi:pseudouridine-5'-phosphate glycosidase